MPLIDGNGRTVTLQRTQHDQRDAQTRAYEIAGEKTIAARTAWSADGRLDPPPSVALGITTSPSSQSYQFGGEAKPALSTQIGGSHYKDYAIQPIEFIERNKIGFIEGNIIKYVCRHSAKNGKQDLLKARHYLDMLLELRYGDDETTD